MSISVTALEPCMGTAPRMMDCKQNGLYLQVLNAALTSSYVFMWQSVTSMKNMQPGKVVPPAGTGE